MACGGHSWVHSHLYCTCSCVIRHMFCFHIYIVYLERIIKDMFSHLQVVFLSFCQHTWQHADRCLYITLPIYLQNCVMNSQFKGAVTAYSRCCDASCSQGKQPMDYHSEIMNGFHLSRKDKNWRVGIYLATDFL